MSAASQQDAAILQLPALAPPPGVIANFTNPTDIGPRLVVLGAILLTFVIVALANRAYTKLCIVRKVSLDDFTVSLAVLGAIASFGLCVYEIRQGIVGRHQYEVRLGELGEVLQVSFSIATCIVTVLYGPTLWLTKGTFCLLYLQIFRPMRWMRINIYIGVTVLTVFYWSFSIAMFVIDTPMPGETWTELEISPRFDDSAKTNVSMAVGGMIADVWLLVLPLVAIHKLQLHQTRRIALTIMFSTGLLAVAASAASVYCRHKLQDSEDRTWTVLNVVNLVNLIEIDAGIITACMPSFARMLHHHLPPWRTLKSRLKSFALACARKGTKQNPISVPEASGPTNANKRDHRLEQTPQIRDLDLGAEIELENMRSVKHYIGGTAPKTFDDDEVLLEA